MLLRKLHMYSVHVRSGNNEDINRLNVVCMFKGI